MRASILLMMPTPQEERTMLYTQKNNAQKLLHAIISTIHWQIIGNLFAIKIQLAIHLSYTLHYQRRIFSKFCLGVQDSEVSYKINRLSHYENANTRSILHQKILQWFCIITSIHLLPVYFHNGKYYRSSASLSTSIISSSIYSPSSRSCSSSSTSS